MRSAWMLLFCGLPACSPPPPGAAPRPPPPPRPAHVVDALRSDDALRLHADAAGLRRVVLPELLAAWASRRADVEIGLRAAEVACGFPPLLAVEEVFVGVRFDGPERRAEGGAVVRVAQPIEQLERCLPPFAPGAEELRLDGRRTWHVGGLLITSRAGFVVVGTSVTEVRGLATRLEGPPPELEGQRLALTSALVTAQLFTPNPHGLATGGARLAVAPAGTLLELRGTFTDAGMARRIERLVTEGAREAEASSASFDPSSRDLLGEVSRSTQVERRDAELSVRAKLPPLSGQTGAVSQLVGLTLDGVRSYFAWSRSEEARERVFAIADALVAYAALEKERGANVVRFPGSAPLVPAEIPPGRVVAVDASSFGHPSWRAIGFSHSGEVHYATDFVTSEDGRRAVARARGDLDGDGLTSLFELEVKLDARGRPVAEPAIRERDAAE